ncbi:phosphate signaling complex protein PhoU [Clostridium vitabionis]|uniref:phosphate signaling complex protein PhoU n=1 Tax=Clostridium vitabionis TaxID=2784388 RepID=UPI00188D1D40|nr:phosphate signaling complex protein PhoU [Clostridium vitabionis]
MRANFDEQLEILNQEMIRMGMLCETAISRASDSLLNYDMHEAKSLVDLLEQVNQKDREIEAICLQLLLRQQPVARDLRTISAALKMVTDMDRIGVQSEEIGEIVARGSIRNVDDKLPMADMAGSVIRMVTEAVDAFVKRDAEMARNVIHYDDVVDNYFDEVKRLLIEQLKNQGESGEAAVDLLMIAKYFERIGDHAVNVANWVIFSITGTREQVD